MNQELPAILRMARPEFAVSRESHHVSNILYNMNIFTTVEFVMFQTRKEVS